MCNKFLSVCSKGDGAASSNGPVNDYQQIQNLRKLERVLRDQPVKYPNPLINSEVAIQTNQKYSPRARLVSLTPEESTPDPAPYANDLLSFSDLDLFELENIGSLPSSSQ